MKVIKLFLFLILTTAAISAEQKVVLISGATGGIGLATVKAFHDKGWKVWAGYRQHIPDELNQMENVRFCQLDVTDEVQIQIAVEMVLKEDGRIDALINNAGYGLIGVEESVTIDEAKDLFDVNFFGVLRLTQAVLPTMREQGSGHIINISSGLGICPLPGLGLYSASKHALEALSESLAATLSNWHIKVSVVEPGYVKNNWGKHCVMGSRPCSDYFYNKLNQGILEMLSTPQGQPSEEVAEILVEIAENPNPNVRYQTGQDVSEWINSKSKDPTGMWGYNDNLEFIRFVIQGG